MPLVSFYTPWKHKKSSDFLIFSEGIDRTRDMKWLELESYTFSDSECNSQWNTGKGMGIHWYFGGRMGF